MAEPDRNRLNRTGPARVKPGQTLNRRFRVGTGPETGLRRVRVRFRDTGPGEPAVKPAGFDPKPDPNPEPAVKNRRSEERRVGKECRL